MTTGATPVAPSEDRVETFLDWFRINSKWVGVGAAVVALAALLLFVLQRQSQNQAARAYRQLQLARQSAEQGNVALATSDLQKLVQSDGDTPAGLQGAMLLAQLHFDRGEHDKGLKVLQDASARADEDTRASLLKLRADGLSQAQKHAEAAAEYRRAAEAARSNLERVTSLAAQARALTAAGKPEEARRVWQEIIDDPRSEMMAGEARVRIGELTAKAIGR